MKSRTTAKFRKLFSDLPPHIQEQVREAYKQFITNPWHPSLCFKHVHTNLPVYSVRVGKGYRAVGQRNEKGVVWFWIGTHADYDKLLFRL